jgi:hypothetical protein
MLKARIGKEAVIRMPNQMGVLAQLAKVAADKGVNILAVSGWVEGNDAVVRFVADDHLRVVEAFREKKFSLYEKEVVITEVANKAGTLRRLTETLAEKGIDLRYLYATASDNQAHSLVVFGSSDNARAAELLNARAA